MGGVRILTSVAYQHEKEKAPDGKADDWCQLHILAEICR